MSPPQSERAVALEEFFLSSGLPHLIHDYDPREDTLTRLRPALLVLFLIGLGLVLRPDWPVWARALGVLGGLALALAALVGLNLARGRPPTERPQRVGFLEAGIFVLAPAAVDLVTGDEISRVAWIAAGSVAVAGVLYALATLGIVPLLVHQGRAAASGLRETASIALRALPPVLAVLLFLFLASEVWQAFGLIEGWRFGSVLVVFALMGTAFLVVTLRPERRRLAAPQPGEETARLARLTPAAPLVDGGVSPVAPPLSRMARANVAAALVVSLGSRVIAVGAAIALFFMLFGVLVVDRELTASWIGESPHVLVDISISGREVVLTEQLVRVSTLLGGFAALYFIVVALTEAGRREDLIDDEIARLDRVMAAWAYYRGWLSQRASDAGRDRAER